MSELLLRVNLNAGYGKQTILDGVQFDLAKGESLGLIGSSGTGKSTLILSLMGLLSWQSGWVQGEVFFEGRNLLLHAEQDMRRIRGRRIALVPQSPMSALNGSLRLLTHFEEAWRAHEAVSRAGMMSRVETLLDQVDLPLDVGFLSRKPSEISVGQAQRVVIALALLHRPAIVIADEPTSALDAENRGNVMTLLRKASLIDGTALLYVSHDLLSVLQLCQRMAVLHAGRIVETLPVSGIEDHASHPVTLGLLRSLPVPAGILNAYRSTLERNRSGPQEDSAWKGHEVEQHLFM